MPLEQANLVSVGLRFSSSSKRTVSEATVDSGMASEDEITGDEGTRGSKIVAVLVAVSDTDDTVPPVAVEDEVELLLEADPLLFGETNNASSITILWCKLSQASLLFILHYSSLS